MEKQDFLLLVVAAAKDGPLTPVQLQKSLFLIERAHLPEAPPQFYEFAPYDYGPFDAEIYADADLLASEGLVVRIPSSKGTWTDTSITPDGLQRASALESTLSSPSRKYVQDVVQWVQSLSFSDLVRAIYAAYPAFQVNSVFHG